MSPKRPIVRQFVHLLRYEFVRARWMLAGYATLLVAVMIAVLWFGDALQPVDLFASD